MLALCCSFTNRLFFDSMFMKTNSLKMLSYAESRIRAAFVQLLVKEAQ